MSRRVLLLVIGLSASIAAVAASLAGRDAPRATVRPSPAEAPPTATTEAPPRSAPEPMAKMQIAPAARAGEIERLRAELASDDEPAKIAAIEAAVHDGAIGALPLLTAIDLAREPEAAPAIIHAVASLAARGTRRDREAASTTLAQWLEEETRRHDLDAIGNVPNIVEALGEAGGDPAVDALVHALDAGKLELSLETLAVQQLAALGEARARPAVSRFALRVAAMPEGEGIERELRDEARVAAEAALARLAH